MQDHLFTMKMSPTGDYLQVGGPFAADKGEKMDRTPTCQESCRPFGNLQINRARTIRKDELLPEGTKGIRSKEAD